jgi:hypothetical protein
MGWELVKQKFEVNIFLLTTKLDLVGKQAGGWMYGWMDELMEVKPDLRDYLAQSNKVNL